MPHDSWTRTSRLFWRHTRYEIILLHTISPMSQKNLTHEPNACYRNCQLSFLSSSLISNNASRGRQVVLGLKTIVCYLLEKSIQGIHFCFLSLLSCAHLNLRFSWLAISLFKALCSCLSKTILACKCSFILHSSINRLSKKIAQHVFLGNSLKSCSNEWLFIKNIYFYFQLEVSKAKIVIFCIVLSVIVHVHEICIYFKSPSFSICLIVYLCCK